jgi:hypothetical protein
MSSRRRRVRRVGVRAPPGRRRCRVVQRVYWLHQQPEQRLDADRPHAPPAWSSITGPFPAATVTIAPAGGQVTNTNGCVNTRPPSVSFTRAA